MNSAATSIQAELDAPFTLQPEQIVFYRENGYIKLRQVFSPQLLQHFQPEISRQVQLLNTNHLPMEQRSTYDKAFLQVMNLWTKSEAAKEFVMGKRLARLAAELMGCTGVRLYHDQALYKESGGGITPWHADQYYWPVSGDNTVTAWVPLQETPLEMGPLAFCEKSHRLESLVAGRNVEISDESEQTLRESLKNLPTNETPFALGDVSFHAGWTFHRAGVNRTSKVREVMTVIYIDQQMRLAQPKNKNQTADHETWAPGVQVGAVMDSPLNPIIYSD